MAQINIAQGTNVSVAINRGPLNNGSVGGTNSQVQFNKNGVFGGVSSATSDGSNLTIQNLANIKIGGGAIGQVISTDGAGNLSFIDYASGNGVPSGPDFSVQIANAGNFYGESDFSYVPGTKMLYVPSVISSSIDASAVTTDSLGVSGIAFLPNLPNIRIGGGLNNQVISTDGLGNLSWTTLPTVEDTPPAGSNTQIQFNDDGVFGADPELFYDKSSNTLSAVNISATNFYGNGQNLTDINGANVFGVVPLANISFWSGNANTANYATDANYANFAGDVVNPYQANILRVGTLEQLTVEGIINLNDLSNIHITGGSTGQVITTDGTGNLSWTNGGGGSSGQYYSQPAVEFRAPISSHNQKFTSTYIGSFASAEFASVYVNGVLQEIVDYSINGNELTIIRWIAVNDLVTVGATGSGTGSTPNSYPTLNGNVNTYLNGIGQWQPVVATETEIQVEFDFGVIGALSVGTIPAGAIITDVTVVILTGFNSLAQISIGDPSNSSLLMSATDNDPSVVGSYSTEPAIKYSTDTELFITVIPSGSGAGSGLCYINYQ
jgi:hypothetical protein